MSNTAEIGRNGGEQPMRPDCQEIRELTNAAHEKALAEHGDLGLSCEAYSNRVADALVKCAGGGRSPAELIGGFRLLHTSDLYLSASCAAGIDDAWARLRLLYRGYITELFRWKI